MPPVLVVVLLLSGCGGPSAPVDQGGGAVMEEPHPDAMRAMGWLEFADLSLHVQADGRSPSGPHVRGWVLGGTFAPSGDVVGGGGPRPRGRILTPGFLELRTRAFVRRDGDRPPQAPYVDGLQDAETGGFHPTSPVRREAVKPAAESGR